MIHIIGHTGMVGSELMTRDRYMPMECDVTSPKSINKALLKHNPDVIVYLAAKTNVDWCEDNPNLTIDVNVGGVRNLLDSYLGRILYVSTSYVFNGKKFIGSGYTERHDPSPINMYGHLKLCAEAMLHLSINKDVGNVKIIRTSKLYNREYLERRFEGNLQFSDVLKRSYLHVKHFCDGLDFVLDNWDTIPNILNIAGTDILSEFMFLYQACKRCGIPQHYVEKRTSQLRGAVPRPLRAGLNVRLAKSLGVPLYSAFDGLEIL